MSNTETSPEAEVEFAPQDEPQNEQEPSNEVEQNESEFNDDIPNNLTEEEKERNLEAFASADLASLGIQVDEETVEEPESVQEPEQVSVPEPVQNPVSAVVAPPPKQVQQPPAAKPAVAKQQVKNEEYMKVANSKIDYLVEMIGELIINQSLIDDYVQNNYSSDNMFIANMNALQRTTRELQDISMFLRMVSLKSTFQKISRIARDTIQELNKSIDFQISGEMTEIDRAVADRLLDPLVHLIKNAISHGIEEDVQERKNTGKAERGRVELNAFNKRGKIYIEVKDDGKGIDVDRVYQKALEKGIIDPNREYSKEEIQEFILLPGFSTAQKVDNISGRGVGMDVVKTEIMKIGGKIDIKSDMGKGTTMTLEVPVNHAIMNGTIINLNGQQFIIPTINVKEIILPEDDKWVRTNNQKTFLKVREHVVPIIQVAKFLGGDFVDKDYPLVVLLEVEGELKVLPITNVVGRQEVVVKPTLEEFINLRYISGMSILGNGKVSLIFDVDYLFVMET
jgi:two-component system chemotaxis sensor kinase CheA